MEAMRKGLRGTVLDFLVYCPYFVRKTGLCYHDVRVHVQHNTI
jgi:hypothetical protein